MEMSELKSLIGQTSEPTPWLTVTQEMVTEFANLTGDHQWIHIDVERCRKESPYGTTVAHGMLVQSLIPTLLGDSPSWMKEFSAGINYGSDKVRFSAPVRTGTRIRATSTLKEVEETRDSALRIVNAVVIEVEGETKPACYAELVGLLYP